MMGKTTGFKEYNRETPTKRSPDLRVKDYQELYQDFSDEKINEQAARCMDCGVPFCHVGCPLGNIIPDFNDLVYRGLWQEAYERLQATNNFPEFTGRLCPAPCEEACVLGITDPPVAIELIEKMIVETAFSKGWIIPEPPAKRTGKRVAVIGSGPSGLACAQQLNRAGHFVTVYERSDRLGGLLRYGIPEFKMEKQIIDRRLEVMAAEGIQFEVNCHIGQNMSVDELQHNDAIILCIGSTRPRDLPIPGRDLDGVFFAMDFLSRQNKICAGDNLGQLGLNEISAAGKDVIVIGGGDTGSDCIGTSNRHGAKSVTNFELLPKPSLGRPQHQPWPYYPMTLRTSASHEEGCNRNWSIHTKEFIGENGKLKQLKTVNAEFVPPANGGRPELREVPGTEKIWNADLVLLALGFTGPEPDGVIAQLGLELDPRGNIKSNEKYQTSKSGIFTAGDARRGQSLIVWAISEGREAAMHVDTFLMGKSNLPSKGSGMELPRV